MNTPPDNFYLIAATFAMALVTFLTRLTPIILPKRLLDAPLLLAVNKALPLSVMTLLILTSLHWQQQPKPMPNPMIVSLGLSPLLAAEILALLVVLLSYHWKKQLLLSMLVGIASLNGFLWGLNLIGFR
ncbi:AzlD domain-containing protein [Moraxella osloensis]|nr:AzlD domain-containing protein [Moraxella osloensis]QQU05726.1 AzlD domain-containing protein [Moraxella osloensis]